MTETPDPIFELASKQPDAAAIIAGDETVTCHDLHFRVERASARIRSHSVAAGDRVAVVVEPSLPCVIAMLAVLRLGAVICALNPRQPALVLVDQARQLQSKLLITNDLKLHSNSVPTVTLVDLEAEPGLGQTKLPAEAWPLDRWSTVIYTSGSSDIPKAAVHTWGNHYYSALGSAENIPFRPGDRWLLSLPLYHVGGLAILFRAILGGGCVVIPEHRDEIVATIIERDVTHVSLVATQLNWLFRQPDLLAATRKSLKAVLLGGGPIPDGLVREAGRLGLPVHTSYGMTEMSSQITTTPPGALPDKLGSSGKILPHRELRIEGGARILVRGKVLFAGYLEADGIRRPVDREGWFDTGDLGNLDEDNWLWVSGRKDNLLISGGENIQTEEIERAIKTLPGVEEAIVVSVPDPEYGQRPVAFVHMAERKHFDAEEFKSLLRVMLPKFKVPEEIWYLADPPSKESLKVNRRALARQARARYRRRQP